MKIPFRFMPGSWGLRGQAYERAEIEYLYDGIERDSRILQLDHDPDSNEYKLGVLNLKLKKHEITQSEYDRAKIELYHSGDEAAIEWFDLQYRNGNLDKLGYDKAIATVKKSPWVDCNSNIDENGGISFEMDWNDYWIEELKKAGYRGESEEAIIKKWFASICFNELMSNAPSNVDSIIFSAAKTALDHTLSSEY